MPTSQRTVLFSRLAACVLMVGAAALPAMGQAGDLPAQVTEAVRLTTAQEQQIQAFVAKYKDQLSKAGDPNAVKVARVRLIEPLMNPRVSVDFRMKYSAALVPVLDPLLSDKSDFVASNAAQIIGELATPTAVEKLIATLADKRPTVRFSAAYALQRTFENLMPPRGPGLTAQQVKNVIDSIKTRAAAEEDANVVQELVLALHAATEIPTAQLQDVRGYAVTAAASTIAVRAKAMDGKQELPSAWRVVLWRANRLTRTALTEAPANEAKLPTESLKQAGSLAGHTLALVLRRTQAGIVTPAERDALAQMAALAEATYYFSHSAIHPDGGVKAFELGPMIKASEDKKFSDSVLEIIGPNGALTSPDFGFPDNEFVPKKP